MQSYTNDHQQVANIAPDDVDTPRYPQKRMVLSALLKRISKYVLIDDPGLYLFALAVAVSTFGEGDPLWGMIVGPPSGGKTEALRVVDGIASQHVDTLTVASLLNWHRRFPNSKPEPKGILVSVGEMGLITIADFSTVLDAQRGSREEVFSLLRRVYDGEVQRDLSNGDGGPLRWEGRITLLACCTSAIDNQSAYANALGPRWVYYRLPGRDKAMKRSIMRMARSASKGHQGRSTVAMLAEAFVFRAAIELEDVELSEWASEAVEDIAYLAAQGRGSVPRDFKRDVDGIPEAEEPTRLALQLTLMARCLITLGLTEREAVAMASRVGIGSMSSIRANVLREVWSAGASATSASISKAVGCDWKTANRALEELSCLGIVEHADVGVWDRQADDAIGKSNPWRMAEEHAGLVARVMEALQWPIFHEGPGETSDNVSL
jgi:hypothetical protein